MDNANPTMEAGSATELFYFFKNAIFTLIRIDLYFVVGTHVSYFKLSGLWERLLGRLFYFLNTINKVSLI